MDHGKNDLDDRTDLVLFPEQRVQTCRIYEPLRPLLPSCPTWVQKRGNSGQNGDEGKHGVRRQAVKKLSSLAAATGFE